MSDIEFYKKIVNLPEINFLKRNPKFEISYQPSNLIDFARINPKYDAKCVRQNHQVEPHNNTESFNNKMFSELINKKNDLSFPNDDGPKEYIPSLIIRNDMHLLKRFTLDDHHPGRYQPHSDIQANNEAMLYLNKQYN